MNAPGTNTTEAGKSHLSGSLTYAAYTALKTRILCGEMAPHEQIDEQLVASQLGMSRTPVREALQRLRHEGLIVIDRGRGIYVQALSSLDMRALYQAVTGLEVMAVFLLSRSSPERAWLVPLNDCVARMKAAAQRAAWDSWGAADEEFHRGLLMFCGNPYIRDTGLGLRDRTQRAHMVALRLQPAAYLRRSTTTHAALLDLISSGPPERASRAHFEQRQRGEDALVGAVEKFQMQSL